MKQILQAVLAALVFATASTTAMAGDFSFTGDLHNDNDVAFFTFLLGGPSDVTLRTFGYAGGANAAGSVIGSGGFDPIVSLFFGTGASSLLLNANDDGLGVPIDPSTGEAHDSLLDLPGLTPGIYTVALSQFANFANGPTLGDGFLGGGLLGFGGRSSDWALDIVGVDRAVAFVPEPATLLLAALALAAIGALRRRRSALSSRPR